MSIKSAIIFMSALLPQRMTFAFFTPNALYLTTTSKVACNAVPLSSLTPSLLLSFDAVEDLINNSPEGFENSFNDEIVLMDPTIRLLLTGFGVVVVLALAAKFFLNKMDEAIEKVLIEFENTMRSKYESRWVSIEAKLDGLDEPERSQRLFAIMEDLQQSEPEFMAKVNNDMAA